MRTWRNKFFFRYHLIVILIICISSYILIICTEYIPSIHPCIAHEFTDSHIYLFIVSFTHFYFRFISHFDFITIIILISSLCGGRGALACFLIFNFFVLSPFCFFYLLFFYFFYLLECKLLFIYFWKRVLKLFELYSLIFI